ncbi:MULTISPECIES: ABC-ATPase domain-containing protein [unclassified Corynebacterium]|uniref:ABC-ATPase domain-containing protein n=1 Tax=unclassified Corynebacterium TaxID=2624378 RepID=UPI0029CA77FF|nr:MULTISPECIES: ABC-ATPase domain-containing protein [unclassified Corynebacterium]WPF65851.1 ABC-ATPase domain-containing protein [Corynebacterium sp. 22KM0430]WPF68344.1 ABC-ATPase domain-containing protein [Corynebacterium sp. 21KM1197]
MKNLNDLRCDLTRLDGKPYRAYRDLTGTTYDLGRGVNFTLDRAQVDPYAPPSLAHLRLPLNLSQYRERGERVAAADYLTRVFDRAARGSRDIQIGRIGQQILERTTAEVHEDYALVRFTVALPAAGRRIKGRLAATILTEALPGVAGKTLGVDTQALDRHVSLHRDQEWLRGQLPELGLVAFVGEGAVLPRRSGDSDEPLVDAVPFASPESLRREVTLPSGRTLTGMGVPEGVTVIVGGGYHGKSTLLRAIERGVYPHIEGDGREWVIARPAAVSVRAEDGRAVSGADISAFINNLPSGEDTTSFSTTNASGSTSQAANLVEAIEAGADTLLIDEDTSATNFMIRDERMRALISADREPITPFVDTVRALYRDAGVSTVLVAGGSGAFFSVADHVIALDAYRVSDVTSQAHDLGGKPPSTSAGFRPGAPRVPVELRAPGKRKPAAAKGRTLIRYGKSTIDLGPAEQLVDQSQTTGIAHAIDLLERRLGSGESLRGAVEQIAALIDAQGLSALSPHRGHPGLYARPRVHEIMAAVNRYRGLEVE